MDVAIRATALCGEGPRWDAAARRLLWVDIPARELHSYDPATGEDRAVELDASVCAAAPVEGGGVLVALADRLAILSDAGEQETLAVFPHGPEMRMNDGACDPQGRFWVGSMALDLTPGIAALYRYADGSLERVLEGVSLSNGIGWSPDGTRMYYADSLTHRLDVFDFDGPTGTIENRRTLVTVDEEDGLPDGIAVDDEGFVWLAVFGGGEVRRYDPAGRLDRVLTVPARDVTACCFGGDDGRSLYVTTATEELSAGELARTPLAGSVFVADAGVAGPPAQPFRHARSASSTAPSVADATSAR